MMIIIKKLMSILLTLCMTLTVLPGVVSALEQPPNTDQWVTLTREQVVNMIHRISDKGVLLV